MIYGHSFEDECQTEEELEEMEEELRTKADLQYDAWKDEQVEEEGDARL